MAFAAKTSLKEDCQAVQTEYAAFSGLANQVGVEKLELADTFVVVVLDADASAPLLDFSLGSPKTDINRFGAVENQTGGGNVDGVHRIKDIITFKDTVILKTQ